MSIETEAPSATYTSEAAREELVIARAARRPRRLSEPLEPGAERTPPRRARLRRCDERVGHRPGDERIQRLVADVDEQLVARPRPRRRADARAVLERLVERQAQVGVHQRRERPA